MSVKKLVIVGGVAGGASAAARARRLSESAQIVMFERGDYVSFANCGLPYHLGGEIEKRDALLLNTPASLHARFGIDVRARHEVLSIDRAAKTVTVRDLSAGRDYTESYDALILAPGAAPIRPPLPGLDDPRVMTLRNIPDLDALMASLTPQVRKVSVVGAGFIGLEVVEALCHRGLEVTLVERDAQVLTPLDAEMTAPLLDALRQKNVTVHLGDGLASVNTGSSLELMLNSGAKIEADIVVLAIGVRPESGLAREAALALGVGGAIEVDAQQRTSDESIYAVGDAVQVRHVVSGEAALLPLAGPANRQARIAVDVIFGRSASYRGSQGTAICKLFDITAGATGLNEKSLKAAGTPYRKVYIHGNDHAGYYPGATPVHLKLLFGEDGRVLGAQAVGKKGVDKRLDVLAVAIQAGMHVADLAQVELSYAPPYGSAKDPVNMAGMAAENLLEGLLDQVEVEELPALIEQGVQLLDVRQPAEWARGIITGALKLPLNELRTALQTEGCTVLSKDKPVIIYCQAGLRGYIAMRQLKQSGYDVRNLNGGYLTWSMVQQTRKGE